eukprot:7281906-Ditylum_brightwellii.AAC.1
MEPTLYFSFSATAYNAPSALTRTTLPGNASSQIRFNKDNRYKKELDTYKIHIAMDDVLKKQIQETLGNVYICQLHHKYGAYLGVTVRDVLNHLMDWYGQSKPADLVANRKEYNKPIDISQPIDAYFARIDDCI